MPLSHTEWQKGALEEELGLALLRLLGPHNSQFGWGPNIAQLFGEEEKEVQARAEEFWDKLRHKHLHLVDLV